MKLKTFHLDTMIKRIFRYLLNRFLGKYLEEFSQDELSYTLSHGKGSLENIKLNVETLNELSEEYNLPFEFLHGSIDTVSILVPWRCLLDKNSVIDVKGLKVVVRPKERPQDVSVFDSMWSSMASSLQLAEECLNSNDEDDFDVPDRSEALQLASKDINSVFANMKIKFQESSFKIEYILPNQSTGISLEIKIASAEYFDETGLNAPLSGHTHENEKPTYESSAYFSKNVVFEGVGLYTAEFTPELKTFVPLQPVFPMEGMDPARFVPGSPEMPPTHASLNVKKTEPHLNSDPVLISKLKGQQSLKLKIKKNEAATGPKVDVEFNFGALNLFLTPQQVHLLFALMNGLIKHTDPECDPSKKVQLAVANKPMREADYALVEQELMRQQITSNVMPRSLKNQQGWSSHFLDESDVDFHLMTMENKVSLRDGTPSTSSQDDLLSSMNSDARSDCTGSYPYNQKSKSRGSSVHAILTDSLSELTHFRGSLSSLLVIILHDDSVQETITGIARSDAVSLNVQAEKFFSDLLDLQMSGLNFKDFACVREPISKLCETNHLRLLASGIALDGKETSSSTESILKFNVSFHQFEVLECLFNSPTPPKEKINPKYMQLMTFIEKNVPISEPKEICLKLSYSKVEYTSENRINKPPANKLDIEFGNMMCDIDISLTDRIRTLLNFSNFADYSDNKWDHYNSEFTTVSQSSSKTEVTLSSSCLTINLRFPIPDLRSVHDMERAPWWQQNVHKEILVLVFQRIKFKTTLDNDDRIAKYEIECQDVHGLLKKSSSEEAISFLRVSVDPDVDEISRNSGFDWPRLVIQRLTKVISPDLECASDGNDELYSCSLSYALMANLVNDSTPFCSTSVVHDRKEANENLPLDHDEIIKPSDKDSMINFVDQTKKQSGWIFDFTLPTVNIVFPDKEFFELLFNRLSSDLVLWENTSLSSTNTYDTGGFKVHIPGLDDNFPKAHDNYVFKPFNNDSNSDSEDEDNMYMSVHDYYEKRQHKQKKLNDTSYTKFSLIFSITKGSLLVNTPLLDNNNDLVSDLCGKLRLHVEECLIFVCSSYKGDPNESYICLISEKSALYHEGYNQVEGRHPIVQPLTSLVRDNLKCIIYESDPGMHLNTDSSNKEMLKFAVHSVKNPKQQIKTFKIAIEISEATLRHYMVPRSEMWINQIIEYMKIQNYPVNGHIPPSVVTELHLNLSNCAIDYRPFRLPYKTALTIENFNMSCNVTQTTPSFNFRIISEELRLFISNNLETKKIDLKKNFVCVIDTGFIDISIKRTAINKDNSRMEMSISNNKIHIRTCADSFKALLDLINYLSTNGDMDTSFCAPKENENMNSCIKSKSMDSETENLNVLMAEAMKECTIAVNGSDVTNSKNNSDFEYCNTDDEFCILEDDPGVGLIPRNGEPQIRVLTDEPIVIVEDHFSVPPGKSDVLKAPKGYPDPLLLVKLQEMALIWHLYGGSDFRKSNSKKVGDSHSDSNYKSKHGVTFADEESADNEALSFCKVTSVPKDFDSNIVQFSMDYVTINQNQRTSSAEFWLHKGGSGRNHDVLMELQMNKVQFQREIYPEENEHASRYILLINDIEIRDRLAVSQINKFLYQYATKDLPRQSHANMIDVKAEYTRPDPKRKSEECSLKVSCKPIRLNVDQDSLMFLVDFFQEVLEMPMAESSEAYSESDEEKVPPTNSIPASSLNMCQKENLNRETFYRFFSFAPDVLIRLDYHGKRVQMEQGALKGLILGLGQLNASEIKLKRLCYRYGLLGHQKLLSYALNEWQQDILKNQLPSLLGGVGPMHSFVQLFQGVKDLFYLPVAQYQRDGQIVRGLQRGASSFSTSTVIAALDLTSRFFNAVQGTAQVAYDMVSPGPRNSGKYQRFQENYRKNSQPADIIEGVATAYNVVKEGLEDTARTIYRVASTEHEHKGVPGAVGGVLRQIPPSLFKPIILGSEATSYVLDGVRHQLMPDAHQEDIHKWKMKNN